jgi:hypothetical protein
MPTIDLTLPQAIAAVVLTVLLSIALSELWQRHVRRKLREADEQFHEHTAACRTPIIVPPTPTRSLNATLDSCPGWGGVECFGCELFEQCAAMQPKEIL